MRENLTIVGICLFVIILYSATLVVAGVSTEIERPASGGTA
jgi:hypothetical protein